MYLLLYFVELILSQDISALILNRSVARRQVCVGVNQHALTAYLGIYCAWCFLSTPSPAQSKEVGAVIFTPFTGEACRMAPG